MSNRIHQDLVVPGTPDRVYAALTDGPTFAKMSGGAPATIDARDGGAFACFGGMIHGFNVECVPGTRIVQAWRVKNWDPGVWSIARYELRAEGGSTRVVLDHAGFPEGLDEHLGKGWHANYWEPLRKLLG